MAKTKKKKNYRLRKSVRRTLGALFMISAIIIAAIPFPDAAAEDGNTDNNTGTTSNLEYSVEADDDINTDIALNGKENDTTYPKIKSYTTRATSGGGWMYEWQFEFYVVNTNEAIISKYNNEYSVENIELQEKINTKYVTVKEADYNTYFNSGNGSNNITLNLTSYENVATKAMFEKYFPDLLKEFETLKGKHEKYQAWVDAGSQGTGPEQVTADQVVVAANPNVNLSATQKSEYYFEYALGLTADFAMTPVEAPTGNSTGDIFEILYIPKAITADAEVPSGYAKDENGFLYDGKTSYKLKGIGDEAFKGITNVKTITLPDNIRYLGTSAFEGSFVQKVVIVRVDEIGNYAFKNCSQLSDVQLGDSTKIIGTEAFSNTIISNISFPYSVSKIGEGAFANNKELTSITFADSYSENVKIHDFAFFNCPKLGSVILKNYQIDKIGEGAFALDSTTLETGNCSRFEFPSIINDDANLGDYILAGRANLKEVFMPSSLGTNSTETIPAHTFEGCMNLSYVEFPDINGSCGLISFDKTLFSQVTNPGFYVKGPALDRSTNVASPRKSTWLCTMNGGASVPYVYTLNGENIYEVSDGTYLQAINDQGILKSCNFIDENGNGVTDSSEIKEIEELVIPGQIGNIQVTGIAEGCFTDVFLDEIQKLTIKDGGALKEIGNNVFAGAVDMKSVYIGDSVEKIGSETFKDCTSLTSVEMGKKVNQIGDRAFKGCVNLTEVKFNEPDNPSAFPLANIGTDAFSTNGDNSATGTTKLTFTGVITPDYGPFVWAMQKDNYVDKSTGVRVCYKTPEPTNLTVILDNRNGYPTLVDYTRYEEIDSDLRNKYESGTGLLTPAEEALIKASLNVIVPEGVMSVDAEGYFNNTSKKVDSGDPYAQDNNNYSISAYFRDDTNGTSIYDQNVNGIYTNDTNIEQTTLTSVKYLPEELFDNCSNLQVVQVGDDIEEIDSLPFIHCDSLSSVSFENDKFTCSNGIIYENTADGTKKLIECLTSRGLAVGSSTIDVNNDPDLMNVTEIADAAFKDCKNITAFDLTDIAGITRIPDSCFAGAEMLNTVDLPQEVRKIGDKAFATGGNYLAVTVRGREVGLGDDAFGNENDGDRVKQAYLISYEDSAVRSDAKSQGANVERTLDEMHTFKFYDETGLILIKTDYVEHGGNAEEPEESEIPVISGKKFVGWNKSLKNITADDFTLAVYESDGTGSGDGTGGNGSGGTGSGGTGTGGSNVNGGIDTDGDGIPDVDADGNKLYKLTVTNGEGSGYYPAGKTVTIKAGNAPGGTTFAYWSCSNQDLIFEDKTDWITTLTMIPSDVTVICNFTGQYTLEVEYGSGSGSYPAGAKVAISAVEAPQGRRFASWVSKTTGLTIENSKKESTVITMPAQNAKVTATYMDTGSISGNSTKPSQNGTTVMITKPGISDKDKASAYVTGSSDNFIVKISESLEAADEVQKALQKKYPDMTRIKYFAMDISLYDAKGINKITDTDGLKVNITMPIPDALKEYAGNNRVGAVVNGELETLNPKFTTIDGVPSITFTATHFSPYTIYVDTGNMTVTNTLDSTPKTGDGIHPKWFLSIGLACISIILFTKRDKRYITKAYR